MCAAKESTLPFGAFVTNGSESTGEVLVVCVLLALCRNRLDPFYLQAASDPRQN